MLLKCLNSWNAKLCVLTAYISVKMITEKKRTPQNNRLVVGDV